MDRSEFKENLLDYTCGLVGQLYNGEIEIPELKKVLIKRTKGFNVDYSGRTATIYCEAFHPEYMSTQRYKYQNANRGKQFILFNNSLMHDEILGFVEKDHTVIEVSNKLVYSDSSHMDVHGVFIICFAYYYRKDGNVEKAIKEIGRILRTGLIRKSEYFLEEDLIDYLYEKETAES